MLSAEQIHMKLAEVQSMLVNAHPTMPILLSEIHKSLKADPENITLLSEEGIGVLVSGLKKQTGIEISASILKSKSVASTRKLKSVGVDDL